MVTSLGGSIGPEHNLLDPGPASCRQIALDFPVIDNDQLAKLFTLMQMEIIRGCPPRC